MKNIIINADDFGLGTSANKAIIGLLDQKLINSTTLMANMPGFDEAVELAHKHNAVNQVGAHLVLTDGVPLTNEISSIPYLFSKSPRDLLIKKLFFINKENRRLIFNEYCAQIEKIRKNGIPISHLDTHHHMHEMWDVLQIVLALLKKYQIPQVRIYNNLKDNGYKKNLYRLAVNKYLKTKRVNFSDYFCDRVDFLSKVAEDASFPAGGRLEIMVHPILNSNGKIVDTLQGEEYDFEYLKML